MRSQTPLKQASFSQTRLKTGCKPPFSPLFSVILGYSWAEKGGLVGATGRPKVHILTPTRVHTVAMCAPYWLTAVLAGRMYTYKRVPGAYTGCIYLPWYREAYSPVYTSLPWSWEVRRGSFDLFSWSWEARRGSFLPPFHGPGRLEEALSLLSDGPGRLEEALSPLSDGPGRLEEALFSLFFPFWEARRGSFPPFYTGRHSREAYSPPVYLRDIVGRHIYPPGCLLGC